MKTGAAYIDNRESHPVFLYRCIDVATRRFRTEHLYSTSVYGQIEMEGVLKDEVERCLRELDPKRKADRRMLEQVERIKQRAIERSAAWYTILTGKEAHR